jgi:hypothetical protein
MQTTTLGRLDAKAMCEQALQVAAVNGAAWLALLLLLVVVLLLVLTAWGCRGDMRAPSQASWRTGALVSLTSWRVKFDQRWSTLFDHVQDVLRSPVTKLTLQLRFKGDCTVNVYRLPYLSSRQCLTAVFWICCGAALQASMTGGGTEVLQSTQTQTALLFPLAGNVAEAMPAITASQAAHHQITLSLKIRTWLSVRAARKLTTAT